jgi:GDP-4-dehydro-6-deoxy-D-mannose reductase
MNAVIIGAAGFVGTYLITELSVRRQWNVAATKLASERINNKNCTFFDLDILDENAVFDILRNLKPDIIYHLAAQSSVALSWEKPGLTIDVNIKGAVNLLNAVKRLGYNPRVVLIGSSEEYGPTSAADCPIRETSPANPQNIYALTKHTQNLLGSLYAQVYKMNIIATRSFNHIGPGQSPQFVFADFCKQAAEISAGKRDPVIYTGNLNVKRDFTDVRDVVNAYALLGEKGKSGETYNVGSGKAVELNAMIKQIINFSSKKIELRIDEKKLRLVDVPVVYADITKIHRCIGWLPEIPLDRTIRETYEYWLNIAETVNV